MINAATLDDTVRRLRRGERATLAQAMTLVESSHPRHQPLSTQLLDAIMPFTGNALRLGITGTPGAGKSTFLEAFGMLLIRRGLRVAAIVVDPSSPVSGGSILGDKNPNDGTGPRRIGIYPPGSFQRSFRRRQPARP